MATFYLDSGSISDLVVTNANLTGSLLGTASYAVSAAWAPGGAGGNLVVAAGGSTNTVSQLVFSNAIGGVSFGLNGSTVTAYEGAARSYYENIPLLPGSTTISLGGGAMYMQPFVLPYDVSVSYIRIPVSSQFTSNTIATTNNTTVTMRQAQTFWFNVYTAGNGASSKSLQLYASASAVFINQISGSQGTSTNAQSTGHNITYYVEGNSSEYRTSSALGGATNLAFSSANLTAFTGNRWLDIPFNSSLSSGVYWMGLQRSNAISTTGGGGNLSNITNSNTFYGVTQMGINFSPIGATANLSSNAVFPGLGTATVSANGATTNSVALSNISISNVSQLKIPFQFLRFE